MQFTGPPGKKEGRYICLFPLTMPPDAKIRKPDRFSLRLQKRREPLFSLHWHDCLPSIVYSGLRRLGYFFREWDFLIYDWARPSPSIEGRSVSSLTKLRAGKSTSDLVWTRSREFTNASTDWHSETFWPLLVSGTKSCQIK